MTGGRQAGSTEEGRTERTGEGRDNYLCHLFAGVSLEASYRRSTAAYVTSHCRLLNFTFKRVVVVISSTETGKNNYESLYFIL